MSKTTTSVLENFLLENANRMITTFRKGDTTLLFSILSEIVTPYLIRPSLGPDKRKAGTNYFHGGQGSVEVVDLNRLKADFMKVRPGGGTDYFVLDHEHHTQEGMTTFYRKLFNLSEVEGRVQRIDKVSLEGKIHAQIVLPEYMDQKPIVQPEGDYLVMALINFEPIAGSEISIPPDQTIVEIAQIPSAVGRGDMMPVPSYASWAADYATNGSIVSLAQKLTAMLKLNDLNIGLPAIIAFELCSLTFNGRRQDLTYLAPLVDKITTGPGAIMTRAAAEAWIKFRSSTLVLGDGCFVLKQDIVDKVGVPASVGVNTAKLDVPPPVQWFQHAEFDGVQTALRMSWDLWVKGGKQGNSPNIPRWSRAMTLRKLFAIIIASRKGLAARAPHDRRLYPRLLANIPKPDGVEGRWELLLSSIARPHVRLLGLASPSFFNKMATRNINDAVGSNACHVLTVFLSLLNSCGVFSRIVEARNEPTQRRQIRGNKRRNESVFETRPLAIRKGDDWKAAMEQAKVVCTMAIARPDLLDVQITGRHDDREEAEFADQVRLLGNSATRVFGSAILYVLDKEVDSGAVENRRAMPAALKRVVDDGLTLNYPKSDTDFGANLRAEISATF